MSVHKHKREMVLRDSNNPHHHSARIKQTIVIIFKRVQIEIKQTKRYTTYQAKTYHTVMFVEIEDQSNP